MGEGVGVLAAVGDRGLEPEDIDRTQEDTVMITGKAIREEPKTKNDDDREVKNVQWWLKSLLTSGQQGP